MPVYRSRCMIADSRPAERDVMSVRRNVFLRVSCAFGKYISAGLSVPAQWTTPVPGGSDPSYSPLFLRTIRAYSFLTLLIAVDGCSTLAAISFNPHPRMPNMLILIPNVFHRSA